MYIILSEVNGRYSAFNTSVFLSRRDAENFKKFYIAKQKAIEDITASFFKNKIENVPLNLVVVKLEI